MHRKRRLLAIAAACATMLAGAALATGSARAESNGGVRIMPLGDSITDGFTVAGGYRIGLWQRLTSAGYQVDFVGSLSNGPASLGDHDHEGHSGWTIAQVDANVVNWLHTQNPHTVLLHIGTNDMPSAASGAPARLGTLLDHITATVPDAEVFVAQIIPMSCCDAAVRTFNAAIPGLVSSRANAGRHIHLVDMYDALTTADLADGIHPNAGGYDKMAAVWYQALRSVPGSLSGGTPSSPSSSPPTSRPPSSSPSQSPSSPPPTGRNGACTASYRVTNNWNTGFQSEVTVGNAGSSTLNGWTVHLTLASGQSITNLWNGTASGTSGAVSVRNSAYNGTLPGNGSTTFGFVANGNGATAPSGLSCTSP